MGTSLEADIKRVYIYLIIIYKFYELLESVKVDSVSTIYLSSGSC